MEETEIWIKTNASFSHKCFLADDCHCVGDVVVPLLRRAVVDDLSHLLAMSTPSTKTKFVFFERSISSRFLHPVNGFPPKEPSKKKSWLKKYYSKRTLGFQCSQLSLGCDWLQTSAVNKWLELSQRCWLISIWDTWEMHVTPSNSTTDSMYSCWPIYGE